MIRQNLERISRKGSLGTILSPRSSWEHRNVREKVGRREVTRDALGVVVGGA